MSEKEKQQRPTVTITTPSERTIVLNEWLTEFEEEKIEEAYHQKLNEIKSRTTTESDGGTAKEAMTNARQRTEQEFPLGTIKAAFRDAQSMARKFLLLSVDDVTKNVEEAFSNLPPTDREEAKTRINAEVDRILTEKKD